MTSFLSVCLFNRKCLNGSHSTRTLEYMCCGEVLCASGHYIIGAGGELASHKIFFNPPTSSQCWASVVLPFI